MRISTTPVLFTLTLALASSVVARPTMPSADINVHDPALAEQNIDSPPLLLRREPGGAKASQVPKQPVALTGPPKILQNTPYNNGQQRNPGQALPQAQMRNPAQVPYSGQRSYPGSTSYSGGASRNRPSKAEIEKMKEESRQRDREAAQKYQAALEQLYKLPPEAIDRFYNQQYSTSDRYAGRRRGIESTSQTTHPLSAQPLSSLRTPTAPINAAAAKAKEESMKNLEAFANEYYSTLNALPPQAREQYYSQVAHRWRKQ
ncbi:hypothetical protein K474DRAFT_1661715 [Panus rudis PR-1116 ss-1]|nr:hypothetical protein K474DRAFT_1661715 [Panus rudis PR-1116 ss-1]